MAGTSTCNDAFPDQGRLAGIDFGTVRIGIAVTDPDQRLASPYEIYQRRNPAADAEYFQRLVREERIVGFVVGLPVFASGEESQKSAQARAFGDWLRGLTGLPVRFYDERYTSVLADQSLLEAQMTAQAAQSPLGQSRRANHLGGLSGVPSPRRSGALN